MTILQGSCVACIICNEEAIIHQLLKDKFEILKKEHSASHKNEKYFFNDLFANIVLLPGPGHFELNIGRFFIKTVAYTIFKKICIHVRFPH